MPDPITRLEHEAAEWRAERERQERNWDVIHAAHIEAGKRLGEASRLLAHAVRGLEGAESRLAEAREELAAKGVVVE